MLASRDAVLSTPNANPVILNFARQGEDGHPTVYVTEGRQPVVPSPWILQSSNAGPYGQVVNDHATGSGSSCAPCSSDEEPKQVSGCCLSATCNTRAQQKTAYPDAAPAVDLLVSPAPLPGSSKPMMDPADSQGASPPEGCILGKYLKSCLPTSCSALPTANQVKITRQSRCS